MALLEEEKGNLQLSLVDFDELKGRNQDRDSVVVLSTLLSLVYIKNQRLESGLFSYPQ